LRNTLLEGIPHIQMNERDIEYQNLICRRFGGGLLRIELTTGICCAVVELAPEFVIVKELLAPDGLEEAALSAIAATYPSAEYIVRTPVKNRNHANANIRRFGMLAAPDSLIDFEKCNPSLPWYGLAFD